MAGCERRRHVAVVSDVQLGKRSLTLNLKAPEARAIVHALVRDADVVVENFTPGVMQRLGFDYASLAQIKPDLVYCSISGYGQSGPKSALAAYDGAIQAASGMMAITGHPETGPLRTGYMPVDMATALNTAFAIAPRCIAGSVTGEGQHLDVAMMDTAIVMQAPQVSGFLVHGVQPELFGNRSPTRQPTANVFATADGYIQVVALKEPQVQKLFAGARLRGSIRRCAIHDRRCARREYADAVNALLTSRFARDTTGAWLERLIRPACRSRRFGNSRPSWPTRNSQIAMQSSNSIRRRCRASAFASSAAGYVADARRTAAAAARRQNSANTPTKC